MIVNTDIKDCRQTIELVFDKNIITYWKIEFVLVQKISDFCSNPILYSLPDLKNSL